MSGLAAALAAVGGAFGAVARVAVLRAAQHRGLADHRAVGGLNAFGCLLAGIATGAALSPALAALLVSGVLGAFTTLSSWVAALANSPQTARSTAAWAAADLVAGVLAAVAGHALVA